MAREHFDAVIVGSGFGGSVTSYRLAEAGLDVCLLERGRAYPPGSFPRTPQKMKRNFWDPSEGLYGMFDLWSFDGIDALISSALGGGSIIYANVLIRKDADWFVREAGSGDGYEDWPVTRTDLDPHYDRVEDMLNAQRYPYDEAPYDQTPKTRALEEAAEQLGLDWHRPNLAVTFGNEGEAPVPGAPIEEEHGNLHGRTRTTCRLCGECDIGCNYGSKNTLDYNYLSAAERHGADIRTLCEVRSFEPHDDGYAVGYVEHDLERRGTSFDTDTLPVHTITADRLVLAAGAWNYKLADALSGLAVPERQVLAWFQPETPSLFEPDSLPVWNIETPEGRFYGLPIYDVPGFKLGKYHHLDEAVDPDDYDTDPQPQDEVVLRDFTEKYFPKAAGPTMSLATCMFTNSPDEHFILDTLPDHPQVAVGAGFSGHGFKFASATGEVLADVAAEGGTDHDIEPFDVNRI